MSEDVLPWLKAAGRLSRLSRLLPAALPLPRPTVSSSQVPSLFREPFILSGYRPVEQDWRCYLLSLFQRHNELLNVWSHLLTAPVLLLCWRSNILRLGFSWDDASAPLSFFLLSSLACMFLSAAAHLFQSHSEPAHYFFFFMDYVGVAGYQYGCSIAHYFYAAQPEWRESPVGRLYLPGAAFFAWLSCAGCCFAKSRYRRPYPPRRKIIQVVPAMLAYVLGISPVAQRLCTVPWAQESSLPFHALQVAAFLLCTVFFCCSVPERFFAGRCDFVGQGHQIFHLFLSLCAVFQLEALFRDYASRRRTLVAVFGERQLRWAAVSFPALYLLCCLTALLAMRRINTHIKDK